MFPMLGTVLCRVLGACPVFVAGTGGSTCNAGYCCWWELEDRWVRVVMMLVAWEGGNLHLHHTALKRTFLPAEKNNQPTLCAGTTPQLWLLFEDGIYFTRNSWLCSFYSRVVLNWRNAICMVTLSSTQACSCQQSNAYSKGISLESIPYITCVACRWIRWRICKTIPSKNCYRWKCVYPWKFSTVRHAHTEWNVLNDIIEKNSHWCCYLCYAHVASGIVTPLTIELRTNTECSW